LGGGYGIGCSGVGENGSDGCVGGRGECGCTGQKPGGRRVEGAVPWGPPTYFIGAGPGEGATLPDDGAEIAPVRRPTLDCGGFLFPSKVIIFDCSCKLFIFNSILYIRYLYAAKVKLQNQSTGFDYLGAGTSLPTYGS